MTTDHSELINELRECARYHRGVQRQWSEEVCAKAADALEALTAERTITINDTAVEAMAKARLERWQEIHGIKLGDPQLAAVQATYREEAIAELRAAYAAQNPTPEENEK